MHRLVLAQLAAVALAFPTHAEEPAPLALPEVAVPAVPEPPPREAAPEDSRARQGVYVGVSLVGGGDLRRIRLGVVRSPRLLVGFEGAFLEDGKYDEANYDVGVTFFPWERWFFVRGAVGATVRSTSVPQVAGAPADDGQGVNLLLGLGSAFTGRRGFNLALNLEFLTYAFGPGSITGESPRLGGYAWLGLDWY